MAKKLDKKDITRLQEWHAAIQQQGTPENGYTDSGIWSFLDYVYTKDSHELGDPVKKMPVAEKDYLKIVFLYMLACPVLAVPKSRQMMLSWASSALMVWHAIGNAYREVIYQTKKEDDAFAMISLGAKNAAAGRADFIIQRLPDWLADPNIVGGKGNKLGALAFSPHDVTADGARIPWAGSSVTAVPQGGDQVRGKTPSLFISDEAAFQDEFEAAVIALRPAVAGGGRFIAVSSVDAGSYFNRMVLESPDGNPMPQEVNPIVQRGMDLLGLEWPRGLRSWKTPSGVWVLEVHYTADPAKDPMRDGEVWVQEALDGYLGGRESSGWKTEMEIDYHSGGGDPVFPFLATRDHPVFIPRMDPEDVIRRLRLVAGYDYGSTNPSAFEVWGVDRHGVLYAVWELYEPCTNIVQHTDRMKACPYWDHLDYIAVDPSITAKTQQTAAGKKSIAEQFAKYGVNFRIGRRDAAIPVALRFLSEFWSDPQKPRAFITADCPGLASEVGTLRWEKHASMALELRRNQPEKIRDKDNHAWDATGYVIDMQPGPLVVPKAKRTHTCCDDLHKMIDKKRYDEISKRGGLRVC